ncbi:response regulator transcription factor [Mitsuaria sp. CC2]|jgi:two-component system, OmpR family, response regulator|uniref:response regulator n=1 Tax=Mitsuaria sp. CC2 TaxID=3029186 RepID=UPI00120786FB|nr:MAG: response regulator transcription factor [Rubrivivax sp.]
MKVALIEDNALLRRLMVSRLQSEASITVVGQASSEDAAMSTIALSAPDVVLVDLSIDGGSGLGVIERLRAARFRGRILVLSSEDRSAYESRVLSCGADGFYDKACDFERLVDELCTLANSAWMAH